MATYFVLFVAIAITGSLFSRNVAAQGSTTTSMADNATTPVDTIPTSEAGKTPYEFYPRSSTHKEIRDVFDINTMPCYF